MHIKAMAESEAYECICKAFFLFTKVLETKTKLNMIVSKSKYRNQSPK